MQVHKTPIHIRSVCFSVFKIAFNMPISGLVLTFDSPVEQNQEALDAIKAIPEIDLGQANDRKLAIVVDSDDTIRDREIWDTLQQITSVTNVAIAMVAFDSECEEEASNDTNSQDDTPEDTQGANRTNV
ncbi:hypothetical protein [Rhodopirellula sallentina]|uniref:Uncharacterized protein n=1 Tax=Rhodopirellula sallentina SM41 TaxID=1263870 RepID=M5U7X6_9BACT|nr:hypothetical protein [Rhodopirellula sallentina]EMI53971.1 hypothetical protein RSSM_04575 [Rhodopirellula sallentina SM41]